MQLSHPEKIKKLKWMENKRINLIAPVDNDSRSGRDFVD
jgi:hypothetical protein